MEAKRILGLLQRPPYVDVRVTEALDALLVAAAFEQRVSLLFRGDGVQQLLAGQAPEGQRSVAKILTSLPVYEITDVYGAAGDFRRAGVTADDCVVPPKLLDDAEVADLIAAHDVVLSD